MWVMSLASCTRTIRALRYAVLGELQEVRPASFIKKKGKKGKKIRALNYKVRFAAQVKKV